MTRTGHDASTFGICRVRPVLQVVAQTFAPTGSYVSFVHVNDTPRAEEVEGAFVGTFIHFEDENHQSVGFKPSPISVSPNRAEATLSFRANRWLLLDLRGTWLRRIACNSYRRRVVNLEEIDGGQEAPLQVFAAL